MGGKKREIIAGGKTKLQPKSPESPRVYTLDVEIIQGPVSAEFADRNESVKRTIQILGSQTLEVLHETIFEAFDRDDEHMYEFQIGRRPMDPRGIRYAQLMDADFGPKVAGNVRNTTLDAMRLKPRQVFWYWFDFGDDWFHRIDVKAIREIPAEGDYPRVTARIGESPPQYMNLEDDDESDEDDE